MSAVPIRKLRVADEQIDLLRLLLEEVRGLRADMRRELSPDVAPLLAEIEEFFGIGGRFTVNGLLTRAGQDEGMANALAAIVDMNLPQHAKATSLGRSSAMSRRAPRT